MGDGSSLRDTPHARPTAPSRCVSTAGTRSPPAGGHRGHRGQRQPRARGPRGHRGQRQSPARGHRGQRSPWLGDPGDTGDTGDSTSLPERKMDLRGQRQPRAKGLRGHRGPRGQRHPPGQENRTQGTAPARRSGDSGDPGDSASPPAALPGLRCRWGQGHRGQRGSHLWGMSSMLTRPQTPTTKVSTSHSLTPRAMRKWPPSPHAVPHELAAVCRGDKGHVQRGDPTPKPSWTPHGEG